jgi:hypothetical protein
MMHVRLIIWYLLSVRVVIRKEDVVEIMDIGIENNYQEESSSYNDPLLSKYFMMRAGDTTCKVSKLLDVHHPLDLQFHCEPNKASIPCSLHLTNNTDQNVAFRLIDKNRESKPCFTYLPLYGIVPPRSTYTLIVKIIEEEGLRKETYFDQVIQSSTSGHKYMVLFKDQSECDGFFSEAEETGNSVHEQALKAVYTPPQVGQTTSEVS